MSLSMSRAEREAFLAAVHVGVISIERPERSPLSVPIWYRYQPGGELWIMIESGSLKERLLAQARRFALCVQDETPPFYKFVSVAGPIVSMVPSDKERDERTMAARYLGEELAGQYIAATKADPSNRPGVIVTMQPEAWITADFENQFRSSAGQERGES